MAVLNERWLNKKHDLSALGVKPPFPMVVKLDICNSCNYSCIFCPHAVRDYGTGCIDFELGKRIIRECYENGAREICLAMRGEPLLNPHMPEYVKYAKGIGYDYVFTNSNGFLLNEKTSEKLLDAGLDSIKISFNAPAESYALVHGINGYDIVKKNIVNFDSIRKNYDCRLFVSYVAIKQTRKQAEAVMQELSGYIDEYVIMNANSRGGGVNFLDEEVFEGSDDYTFTYPCSQLFNTINITAEGYVIICCQDFENVGVVGDANHESIADIWAGKTFCDFRKKYLAKELKGTLCMNCLFDSNDIVTPPHPYGNGYVNYPLDAKKRDNIKKRIEELKNFSRKKAMG